MRPADGVVVAYEHCQTVFERSGQVHIPSRSVWRETQRHGEALKTFLDHQQSQVSVERVVLPDATQDQAQQKGISMDGGMVNIRGEGWKEFKVGVIFDVEQHLERDDRTHELVRGRMA